MLICPMLKTVLRMLPLGLALCAWPALAPAQAPYPTRPVHIVVPFPAGTSPDVVMRLVGQKLSQLWDQPVLIENRTGAAGSIGAQAVASAAPDGYTLMYTINSVICANQHLYSKLTYDPLRSFAPVSLVVNLGYVLLASPGVPARNLQELIAIAKAQPGKLNYGSAGDGSGNHIVMELLSRMAGVSMQHIPMRTANITALISGEIDLTMAPYTTGVPAAKGGKLRALGVTLAKRSEAIPDVPAIGEVLPGYLGDAWHGLFVTAGTPPAIVEKVSADTARVLAMPDVRSRLIALGLEPIGNTPAEFSVIVKQDYDKWGKVIRDAKIKLD